jgi:iron complex outermembrane receptor protein
MNKWTSRAAPMRPSELLGFCVATFGAFTCSAGKVTHRGPVAKILICAILVAASTTPGRTDAVQGSQDTSGQLKKLSLAQLGDLEVTTASKEPVTVARTPAAIYVLTQEGVRQSGATSIPEVLRLVPGVEVARIDSDKWSIGVRGFGSRLSRSVLVLIDGRTVYTPLFAGVYWEVQDTLLEDIERIEVIRGPGGTIWGANAVNAVINIITKSAKDTHGMLASIGGGNIDQGSGGFRNGGGNSKSFDYRVYGKAFSRGPEFHLDHDRFDDWQMGQAGFRMDWTAHTRDTLTVQGDLYDADDGEKVSTGSYSPPFTTNVVGAGEVSGGNLLGRWKRIVSGGSDVQLQTYYDRTNRREASFGESRDTFDIDFLHHLTLPRHQHFLWGLGARFSSGTTIEVTPTILFTPDHRTDKLYSGFVQDEIPIVGERLSITIGSKLLHNIYTGFEIQPSARLLWTPTARQTVWAGFTRAVRTPSRIEDEVLLSGLISASPLTFIRLIGDGKFTSEHSQSYEAGYRSLLTSTFHLDIATFYNNYDHLLSIEPGAPISETSPPPTHFVVPLFIRNGVLGATYGIEIAPDWRPVEWWRLEGSYSFLHLDMAKSAGSLDSSTPISSEGSSPQHQVVIQSFLQLSRKIELDQTYRYVSALPAELVRAYSTADVRLAWLPTRSLEFSVVGQNLFQPYHMESRGDPGPLVGIRRGAYAKITWRRNEQP